MVTKKQTKTSYSMPNKKIRKETLKIQSKISVKLSRQFSQRTWATFHHHQWQTPEFFPFFKGISETTYLIYVSHDQTKFVSFALLSPSVFGFIFFLISVFSFHNKVVLCYIQATNLGTSIVFQTCSFFFSVFSFASCFLAFNGF